MGRRKPETPLRRDEVPPVIALPKRAALAQQSGRALEEWEKRRLNTADTTVVSDAVLPPK